MSNLSTAQSGVEQEAVHWTARHGKPIIFAILTLVAVGVYLAKSIPVSVFPSTDFPRIVVGADVGVYPIDQMLVTVTQPLEEALNTVPGLDHVSSITSRGSAEIDLFFDWNVDMYQTLELANAAIARVQPALPANAKVIANRLTFAAFPIMGYSLTSSRMPQTALWELANYTLKPRLNRAAGVSSVVVQGGQVPEFLVQPDPGKLVQTGVTIPNILDAIGADADDRPGADAGRHCQHRDQDHGCGRGGAHQGCGGGRQFRDAGVHGGHGEWQAFRAAEYFPSAGQQHGGRGRRGS
jgi:multidrug efflux pump subunit AcrB